MSAMLNGSTTHAPTDGADQSEEGSSGKKVWHGHSFSLHISSEPGRAFGNEFQVHPCSNFTRADSLFRRAEQG